MPTPAYLSITGVKQGLITAGTFTQDSVGNTYQQGHADQILVQAFSHQVVVPRDPQSGQPTGQRVHKPLMISKVFDKSSPLLFSALTSGEQVTCRLGLLAVDQARELANATALTKTPREAQHHHLLGQRITLRITLFQATGSQ